MKKVTTSDLAKRLMTQALAQAVRAGGSVNIYGGERVGRSEPASLMSLLCAAKVKSCDMLDGTTTLKIALESAYVVQDGEPKWFRVAAADGSGLWDGEAGLEKDDPDLVVPAERLVKGIRVEFEMFEHSLFFLQPEEE
jgi:hypothetical protein